MVVSQSVLDRAELARHAAARNAEESGLSGVGGPGPSPRPAAAPLSGVRRVVNTIELKVSSRSDDEIRKDVKSALLYDPFQPNEVIHYGSVERRQSIPLGVRCT